MSRSRIAILLASIILIFIISGCKADEKKIIEKICKEQGKVRVSKCVTFFSTYPQGFVQDASTEIFDAEGNYIYSCGGYKAFINNEEREKEQKLCADYLKDCRIIKSC